ISGGLGTEAPDQRPPDTTDGDRAARARRVIRGLYAITPDEPDTAKMVSMVEQTLAAGTRLLQHRNKTADAALRREQLQALAPLCASYNCKQVVNDDWQAEIELGIGAVHIGGDEGDAAQERQAVGPDDILGVSC